MRREYPRTYQDLHKHFDQFNQLTPQTQEEINQEKEELKEMIDQLDHMILVTDLKEEEINLLEEHGFELPEDDTPFINILDDQGEINPKLFPLTIAGRIESELVDTFRNHELDRLDEWADTVERCRSDEEAEIYEEYQQAYHEAEDNPESLDWDEDGPIYPQRPNFPSFDREEEIERRKEGLEEMTADNMHEFVSQESIADFFYHEFYNTDHMTNIAEAINAMGLNSPRINRFLHSLDTQFHYRRLQHDYFFTNVLKHNVDLSFGKEKEIDPDFLTDRLMQALAQERNGKSLLNKNEKSLKNNNALVQQKCWLFFIELAYTAMGAQKKMEEAPRRQDKIDILKERCEERIERLHEKWKKYLPNLVKVFPHNSVRQLTYKNTSFPLKPSFQRLAWAASQCYQALCRHGATDSTNIITATLVFVIAKERAKNKTPAIIPMKRKNPSSQLKPTFLNIDLTLGDNPILSTQEAFSNQTEEQACIGASLALGAKTANRPSPFSEEEEAFKLSQVAHAVNTLNIPNKEDILKAIKSASIDAPQALKYHLSSKGIKDREHRHSERALIGTLNNPQTSTIITQCIRAALSTRHNAGGNFVVLGCSLLVYSYRNSICDPCALSLVGLQNTHGAGFLANLSHAINTRDTNSPITLRTQAYKKRKQNPKKFKLTVVAGSNSLFEKDYPGKMLAEKEEYRLTCKSSSNPSQPAIDLEGDNEKSIFEFAEGSTIHEGPNPQRPYQGVFFMSGSFEGKVRQTKRKDCKDALRAIQEEAIPAVP